MVDSGLHAAVNCISLYHTQCRLRLPTVTTPTVGSTHLVWLNVYWSDEGGKSVNSGNNDVMSLGGESCLNLLNCYSFCGPT